MKKLFLLIIFLFCLPIYSQVKPQSHLNFKILNTIVKDGDSLHISLNNYSSNNYYIVYDMLKTINHFTSNNIYKTNIHLIDNDDLVVSEEIVDYECYDADTENKLLRLTNKVEILEIKSNQEIKFKIPFKIKTEINDYCWYSFIVKKQTDKKYYIQFDYTLLNTYLGTKMCEETKLIEKNKGYKLYEEKITSNKVPLEL